jgi:hypothetical protein
MNEPEYFVLVKKLDTGSVVSVTGWSYLDGSPPMLSGNYEVVANPEQLVFWTHDNCTGDPDNPALECKGCGTLYDTQWCAIRQTGSDDIKHIRADNCNNTQQIFITVEAIKMLLPAIS